MQTKTFDFVSTNTLAVDPLQNPAGLGNVGNLESFARNLTDRACSIVSFLLSQSREESNSSLLILMLHFSDLRFFLKSKLLSAAPAFKFTKKNFPCSKTLRGELDNAMGIGNL
eukprot:Sdes_comp20048_c0_seq1m12906